MPGPANDEGDIEPFLVAELLAPDVCLAVVAEADDNRRVGQPIGVELLQDQPDLAVQLGCRVEVGGVVGPRDRVVGLIGGNLHPLGVRVAEGMKRPVRLSKLSCA